MSLPFDTTVLLEQLLATSMGAPREDAWEEVLVSGVGAAGD